jgi:archaellum component FlaC
MLKEGIIKSPDEIIRAADGDEQETELAVENGKLKELIEQIVETKTKGQSERLEKLEKITDDHSLQLAQIKTELTGLTNSMNNLQNSISSNHVQTHSTLDTILRRLEQNQTTQANQKSSTQ